MDFKLSESDKKISELEGHVKDLEKLNWDSRARIKDQSDQLDSLDNKLNEVNKVKEQYIQDYKNLEKQFNDKLQQNKYLEKDKDEYKLKSESLNEK